MKKLIILTVIILSGFSVFSQMIMSAEGIFPDNACQPNAVYFLFERKARPIETIDSIESRLNEIIDFAKNNPSLEAELAIQFVVNCKGAVGGGFHTVKSSGSEELDLELIEFFKTIEKWTPGKKSKRKIVDSWYMWRLAIKDGHISIL